MGTRLCLKPEDLRPGNRVRLLRDGTEAYPRMLDAIRGARRSVFLEMYTFAEDAVGRRFANVLMERARAGVDVRVIYDALGSHEATREFFGTMRTAGVRVVEFHPLSAWFRGFRYRRRDHRKLLVVDGRVAFVGGLNISREYVSPADGGLGWRDTQVEIEGPAVVDLARTFLDLWLHDRPRETVTLEMPAPGEGGTPVGVLSSHRFRQRWEIGHHYRFALGHARKRIWIASAYFLPSARFRRALRKAAKRGLDVRLLVPGKSDFAPVLYAAQRMFTSYLRSGIRIFEWPGNMMHAKTALVDDAWATVGSYNIDQLSLLSNYELTAVIPDESFGRQMEAMFEEDFARSREIRLEDWRRRGWRRTVIEDFFYTFRAIF